MGAFLPEHNCAGLGAGAIQPTIKDDAIDDHCLTIDGNWCGRNNIRHEIEGPFDTQRMKLEIHLCTTDG